MGHATIVKIGGSTIRSPDLARWVEAVAQTTCPTILVPGGGPFANAVRRYQAQFDVPDPVAHEMSVLAMEQFGCILVSLSPRLVAAHSMAEIDDAWRLGRIPVWMARAMVMRRSEIPQDWTITSDALAAWLAGQFPASRLCLVKMYDVPAGSTLEALAGADIVDAGIGAMLRPDTELFIAGPADLQTAGRRFSIGGLPGRETLVEAAAAPRQQAVG